MSESAEDLESAQKLIRFCPLCGYESTKEFSDHMDNGGDWVCENCNEFVEAYVLSTDDEEEEDADEGGSGCGLLFTVLVIVVIAGFYFFT